MPRRAILTPRQRGALFDLPVDETAVHRRRSNSNYIKQVIQACKVVWIPGVEGQSVGDCAGGNEQIRQTGTARASDALRGGKHASVESRGVRVEGQRIPCRGRPLETILTPRTLLVVTRGVWPGRQFGEGNGRNGGFVRKQPGVDQVVIDDHGGIEHPSAWFRHRYIRRLPHQGRF